MLEVPNYNDHHAHLYIRSQTSAQIQGISYGFENRKEVQKKKATNVAVWPVVLSVRGSVDGVSVKGEQIDSHRPPQTSPKKDRSVRTWLCELSRSRCDASSSSRRVLLLSRSCPL